MQSIRPESLTDRELAQYATLVDSSKLPPEWVAEVIKRYAAIVDTLKK